VNGNYGMFSDEMGFSYLRSVQDTPFSQSYSYYTISSSNVTVEFGSATGQGILTASGATIYQNGTNSYFGLMCGDRIVDSYQSGAMLLMSLKFDFESSITKEQFSAANKNVFANISPPITEVPSIIKTLSLDAQMSQMSIVAYQAGGEPNELSKILNKDSSGNFYILSCNAQNLDNCAFAALGMVNYTVNNFHTQFSFSPFKNIYPLSNQFNTLPIEDFNLTAPSSLVTPDVENARLKLAQLYKENQYYQEKASNILNNYPVPLDTQSSFYKSLTNFSNVISNNIDALLFDGDPQYSASSCYNTPQSCVQVASNIIGKLTNITASDLSFLDTIQYSYPLTSSWENTILYPTGSFYGLAQTAPNPGITTFILTISSLTITSTDFYMTGTQRNPDGSSPDFTIQTLSVDANNYNVQNSNHWWSGKGTIPKFNTSPFFFEPYSSHKSSSVAYHNLELSGQEYNNTENTI